MRKRTFNFLIALVVLVLGGVLLLGMFDGASDKIKDTVDKVTGDDTNEPTGDGTGDTEECVHEYKTTYQTSTNMLHVMKKTCVKCGDVIEENKLHNWIEGFCLECVHACPHSGTTGACSYCGMLLGTSACTHNGATQTAYSKDPSGSNYQQHGKGVFCTLCNAQLSGVMENHRYTAGTCVDCGQICGHSAVTGTCSYCGTVLASSCFHSWSVGVCSLCGVSCKHGFANGICTTCGLICTHNWSNGECTICYMSACTTHSWTNGRCTICYEICSHSFSGGVCSICGYSCYHLYSGGVCSICGVTVDPETCSHSYSSGVCWHCGTSCSHGSFSQSTDANGDTYRECGYCGLHIYG